MDELWQRHKVFIVQCVIGSIVVLIAWGVHSSLYGDISQKERSNAISKGELDSALAKGEAPSKASIRDQQAIAKAGQEQIEAMARKVGSVASLASNRVEYVRENVRWLLINIGREDQTDKFVGLYETLPQTCLSELKEEARTVLASKAAQLGRDLDESLGITNAFADDEVPVGIHGLAIVVDVITRAFAVRVETMNEEGEGFVDAIGDIRIAVRSRRSKMNEGTESQVTSFPVSLTMRGDPKAIVQMLLSFNQTSNPMKRMTIIESISGGERERVDSDRVRVTFDLLGLHHIGVAGALEEGE